MSRVLMSKPTRQLLAFVLVAAAITPIVILNAQTSIAQTQQSADQKTADHAVADGHASAAVSTPEFPTTGLMPKEETGALRFLAEHPEFDGRGTVVAIFDTGVDVGAPGLQVTSDGKPKIIDSIDGTGSGDVDTSTVRKVEDGRLLGRSGRSLKIDSKWKNPTAQFYVGVKPAYEFFPDELVARMKHDRGEDFDKAHVRAIEKLRRAIEQRDQIKPGKSDKDKATLARDLDEQLKQLIAAGKSSKDPGPLYDCVVWHDGDVWRAVVDTDEDADLSDELAMTDFRLERQYSTFGSESLLNFSVNIYDEGKTLSIVADCGAHGTHVAGIVSAFYPDSPEFHGVAPGAQIVAVKIGDSRLAGMETGAGLVRGMSAVLRNKVDLINMSFGEPTSTPNQGRIPEWYSQLVNEHNVLFVCSAGNAGPALSTVGAPGGTTSALIGVGAYISPQMMKASYAVRDDDTQQLPYTWSSRGPTVDGAWGVNIFAPGGAIAPVPRWTVQPSMRMNGTSMASPNACGGMALIVSGLKSKGVKYTPHSVKRAIEHTATKIDGLDQFVQGPGLLQIDKAYEALVAGGSTSHNQIDYTVRVNGGRGIYLREAFENSDVKNATVSVRPKFPEAVTEDSKANYSARVVLQSNADWVQTGDNVLLTNGGASFGVTVDPTQLKPGAHAAEVVGRDADAMDEAPLFRVPVTVIRTHESTSEKSLALKSGSEIRRFFSVPEGATWADLTLRLSDADEQRTLLIHPVQLLDGESFSAADHRSYVRLVPGEEKTQSFAVQGGRTLELVMSQYWSSMGDSTLDFDIQFHGLSSSDASITLASTQPVAKINLSAPLRDESIQPSGRFTHVRSAVVPKSAVVRLLDAERDVLPDKRSMYELKLEYSIDQSEKIAGGANRSKSVNFEFPITDGLLYDSPVSHHVWTLYDPAGRLVGTDDIWPTAVSIRPGVHKLVVTLRHVDSHMLESLKSSAVVVVRQLPSSMSVTFHNDYASAVFRKSAVRSLRLNHHESMALFVRAPSDRSVPGWVEAGDILRGTVTYGAKNSQATSNGQRPAGYPIEYVVTTHRKSSSSSKPVALSAIDELKNFKQDGKRSDFDKKFDAQLKDAKGSGRLKVLQAKLHWLDHESHRKQHLADVVSAADAVIADVDVDAIVANTGLGTTAAQNSKVKASHAALVDALYRKARAIGYMELSDVVAKHPIADKAAHDKAFEAAYKELDRWVDTKASQYGLVTVRRDRRKGRFGSALGQLERMVKTSADNYWHAKKRRDMYREAGWSHLYERESRWLAIRYPQKADTTSAQK